MLTKILVFILMFCILIVLREVIGVVLAVILKSENKISNRRLLIFGLALAYVLTIIFTGVGI